MQGRTSPLSPRSGPLLSNDVGAHSGMVFGAGLDSGALWLYQDWGFQAAPEVVLVGCGSNRA